MDLILQEHKDFDSMSPLIQATQMSNAVLAAMPINHINQQLLEATQPMREAVEG